jgi:putative DNA primase/helicase
VKAALKKAVAAVRNAPEGSRNDTLNREAYSLGGYVPKYLDRDVLTDALLQAILANGGDPDKDAKKIDDAIDDGMLLPREIPTRATRQSNDDTGDLPDAGGLEDPRDDGRPKIRCGTELYANVSEASDALGGAPNVYKRDGRLVTVGGVTPDEVAGSPFVKTDSGTRRALVEGTPRIYEMALPTLTEKLTLVARCFKFSKRDRWVPTLPPDALVSALYNRREWPGVRSLVSIVEAPTLRPDGSLLQKAGYDAASGILYVPNAQFPEIPEAPTQQQAAAAYAALVDILADFPHADDERDADGTLIRAGAHKAVVIAHMMAIVGRTAIAGCVPLFGYDANTRGSGKSLQTDLVAMIASGRLMPRMSYPRDDTELEKVLGAYALQGAVFFSLDNVDRGLGGGPLDKVLTARGTVQLRVLGRSEVPTLLWLAVAAATGNNLVFLGDTIRRVLISRLESPDERPEDRSRFRVDDLLAYVLTERPRLVAHILTILRGYMYALHERRSRAVELTAA